MGGLSQDTQVAATDAILVSEPNLGNRRARNVSYIKSIGPVGEPALTFLPPGEGPKGPVVQWPMPRRRVANSFARERST